MFTVFMIIAVVAFAVAAVVLPLRFKAATSSWIEKLRGLVLSRTDHAAFGSGEGKAHERLFKAQIGGGVALAVFAMLLLGADAPFRNHPAAVAVLLLNLLGALGVAIVLVTLFEMARAFLPGIRALGLLSRFGFRALWVLEPGKSAALLRSGLGSRIRASSRVAIVDVTGHELLGKGAGPSGGLLYDTLASMTSVPVQLLLLQPETASPDPEQRRATVFQSVLAEMDISPQNFVRRVRSTLDVVQTLNENRSDDARIEVRFYSERPSFRAIVFDESILVSPWVPRETNTPSPFLEIGREAAEPTLYGAFRFHCVRVWTSAAPKQEAAARANGFKSGVVRREAPVTVPQK